MMTDLFKYKRIILGLLSFIKKQKSVLVPPKIAARYSYSVWMRHIINAFDNGIIAYPKRVCEIGSGNSLGCGIASLLLGVEEYYALDVPDIEIKKYHIQLFDNILELVKNRTDIPNNQEFSNLKPILKDYKFPTHIFNDEHVMNCLRIERINEIKTSLININTNRIFYYSKPNWSNGKKNKNIDLFFSQAVLEYIDDIEELFRYFNESLNPNGFISHQVDLGSHNTSKEWNGHYLYSELTWKLIKGNYNSFITRRPFNFYKKLIDYNNYRVFNEIKVFSKSSIHLNQIDKSFNNLSEEDLQLSSYFFQAVKNDSYN